MANSANVSRAVEGGIITSLLAAYAAAAPLIDALPHGTEINGAAIVMIIGISTLLKYTGRTVDPAIVTSLASLEAQLESLRGRVSTVEATTPTTVIAPVSTTEGHTV